MPRLLGTAHRNPTGKYLKLPSGQDLQYSSDRWEWGCFPEQSRLLLVRGHVPYFKLKFSLTLSLGTCGGFIYFSVCFDQKFIFLVHFSKW